MFVTFAKLHPLVAPTDPPLTCTSATCRCAAAVIVKFVPLPWATATTPLGAIEPPAPAEAVML